MVKNVNRGVHDSVIKFFGQLQCIQRFFNRLLFKNTRESVPLYIFIGKLNIYGIFAPHIYGQVPETLILENQLVIHPRSFHYVVTRFRNIMQISY